MKVMNLSKQEVAEALKNGKITICVVGLGRIGLPTAAILAEAGARVIGADINHHIVQQVNSGNSCLQDEPELNQLIEKVTREGRFDACHDVSAAVAKSDIIIICVPTPINESKDPNYNAIIDASKNIAKTLRRKSLIIIKSTIGPGAVEKIIIPLLEKQTGMTAGKDFGIASCPERASPGEILHHMRTVPRIIGGINIESTRVAAAIWESALGVQIVEVSSPKIANAVKLTENIFRDVNIALMNDFAILYEKLGIDIIEVIDACATKWNFIPHYPGAGVGGPCLPVNSYFLIEEGKKVGYIPRLVQMAREINDKMPEHVVTLVTEALEDVGKVIRGSKIAILGVSYKPNIHDLRMTPIVHICNRLMSMGASIAIYDPLFKGETVFGLDASRTLNEAVNAADCILIGTPHKEFRNLDLGALANISNMPTALVDASRVITPDQAKEHGFLYKGIGANNET